MKRPTPLVLKRLLRQKRIPQVRLTQVLTLENGTHPSEASITQILNRDQWPARTPRDWLQRQITDWLRKRDYAEDEIARAFEIDQANGSVFSLEKTPGPSRDTPPGTTRKRTRRPLPIADQMQLPETEMLSQQTKTYFRLFQDPFLDDVQGPEDVFLSAEQRYIREAMYQAAKHGGFLAVIGESGAGKTVLRKDLLDRIRRDDEPITVVQPQIIDKTRLTASAICDAIVQDLSVSEQPKRSLEAKGRQVVKLLTNSSRSGNAHVLMIEEAHDLGINTLKYLKRFWELEDGFKRLLAIILVGQPELKDALDLHRNWEAREVINRCEIAELQPLDGDLAQYLALKFKRVGKEPTEVFAPDAYDAIHARLTRRRRDSAQVVSMLYPQLVQNLVKRAMNLAAQVNEPRINAELIKGV